MLIKQDARIKKIKGTIKFLELSKKLKKPHLCSYCDKHCKGKKIDAAIIIDAVKAQDGLYVIKCLEFQKREKIKIQRETSYTSPMYNSRIVHPQVRSKIYGK